jgi:hypothetical protein
LQQPVLLRLLKQMKKEQEEMSEPMSLETPAGAARPNFAAAPLDATCHPAGSAGCSLPAAGLHEYITLNAIADNRDSLIGVRQRQQWCWQRSSCSC